MDHNKKHEKDRQIERDKEIWNWKTSNKGADPDFPYESKYGGVELPKINK